MENLNRVIYYETPDYLVPSRLKSKRVGNKDINLEQALAVHAKFVKFRESLRTLGFLPADANFDDEISFVPTSGKPIRAITYKIATISRFFDSPSAKTGRTSSYGFTSEASEITIFQANLLRPVVFGFSASNSEVFKTAFAKVFDGSMEQILMLTEGMPYNKTIELLKIVKGLLAAELMEKDIPATDKNIIRLLSLNRFVERGHSYLKGIGPYGPGSVPAPLKEYIYELIRLDVKLYHSIVALSPEANKQSTEENIAYRAAAPADRAFPMPKHDPDFFVSLNEIPEYYLQRLVAPPTS